MKTGFFCGKWVCAKEPRRFKVLGELESRESPQCGLLGTYEGEGFWNVTVFAEDFTLFEAVEAALTGDYTAKQLIVHEDDLELDMSRPFGRTMTTVGAIG